MFIVLLLQITRGLLQKHGAERVRDTPITEVWNTGQLYVALCSTLQSWL